MPSAFGPARGGVVTRDMQPGDRNREQKTTNRLTGTAPDNENDTAESRNIFFALGITLGARSEVPPTRRSEGAANASNSLTPMQDDLPLSNQLFCHYVTTF